MKNKKKKKKKYEKTVQPNITREAGLRVSVIFLLLNNSPKKKRGGGDGNERCSIGSHWVKSFLVKVNRKSKSDGALASTLQLLCQVTVHKDKKEKGQAEQL